MLDLTALPTDTKPEKVIELLKAQLAQIQHDSAASETWYRDQINEIHLKTDFDLKELNRLRSRECRVLERWVRRSAVHRRALEQWAFIGASGAIIIPLFIVALSLAWRLAVWAVAS